MYLLLVHPLWARGEPAGPSPDQINLALRRTADRLLRASGDSTSRIPAVEQTNAHTWRIQLQQGFSYDTLPHILQASLDLYGIHRAYEVMIRQCGSAAIDLGFHQRDFLKEGQVPCGGRDAPAGCHYIEIVFQATDRSSAFPVQAILLATVALIGIGGGWWWYRRRTSPDQPTDEADGDWLSFGQSRLHLAGHVLVSGGVRQTLTYREAKLLRFFASHPDQVLERDIILREVWADEGVQVGRSIDMFVSRLRKKLKGDPTISIAAVHGLGYKLDTGVGIEV